jgi:rhodanese-related sulfurtransferase
MDYIVVDVREPAEFASGHVSGAINITPAELIAGTEKLETIPKDAPIIVYCLSGGRSSISKNLLENMGYTNVTNGIDKQQVEARYGL